jgi:hypothetical protein
LGFTLQSVPFREIEYLFRDLFPLLPLPATIRGWGQLHLDPGEARLSESASGGFSLSESVRFSPGVSRRKGRCSPGFSLSRDFSRLPVRVPFGSVPLLRFLPLYPDLSAEPFDPLPFSGTLVYRVPDHPEFLAVPRMGGLTSSAKKPDGRELPQNRLASPLIKVLCGLFRVLIR